MMTVERSAALSSELRDGRTDTHTDDDDDVDDDDARSESIQRMM